MVLKAEIILQFNRNEMQRLKSKREKTIYIGVGKQGGSFLPSFSYLCINLELFINFVFFFSHPTFIDLQKFLIWNVYLYTEF